MGCSPPHQNLSDYFISVNLSLSYPINHLMTPHGSWLVEKINLFATAFCTTSLHYQPCFLSFNAVPPQQRTTVRFSLRKVRSELKPQRLLSSLISLDPGEGTTPRVSQQELHWVVYSFTCLPFRPRSEQAEENTPIESSPFLPPSPPSSPFSPSLFFPAG